MHNLDLHNKLMAIAKQVRELKDKHPELASELHPLEATLQTTATAAPARPPESHPYYKAY
jgi:hypothetical protein